MQIANTKYFLNLEKRNCKQGTITQIKINEKDFVAMDKEILEECVTFYQSLYSSKINNQILAKNFFRQPNQKYLNEEEQGLCEGLLKREECLEALKTMSSEKNTRY